jgi:hypothetical protein
MTSIPSALLGSRTPVNATSQSSISTPSAFCALIPSRPV